MNEVWVCCISAAGCINCSCVGCSGRVVGILCRNSICDGGRV